MNEWIKINARTVFCFVFTNESGQKTSKAQVVFCVTYFVKCEDISRPDVLGICFPCLHEAHEAYEAHPHAAHHSSFFGFCQEGRRLQQP